MLVVTLGVGGATAMAALVRRVLVNPLGLPRPGELMEIDGPGSPEGAAAYGQLPAFVAAAGYSTGGLAVAGGAASGYANVAAVTVGFFDVAGVAPRVGRGFSAGEAVGAAPVAVIGWLLAQRGFGGAPQALGRRLQIGGLPLTVIGVMPAGFGFPSGTELWLPMQTADAHLLLTGGPEAGEVGSDLLIARLQAGVSFRQAYGQIAAHQRAEADAWDRAHPHGPKMGVSDAQGAGLLADWTREFQPMVQLLAGAMGLLWLVVCANLGGVLLARALHGQRELAIRTALGASRRQLARLWLADAAGLVVPGSAAGLGVTALLMDGLRYWAPAKLPGLDLLWLGWSDVGVLAACGALTLLIIALPPLASLLRRGAPAELMQNAFYGSRGRGRAAVLWPVLVAVELAAALVLTAGAGLLMVSFAKLGRVPLGFTTQGVLTQQFTVFPALAALPRNAPSAQAQQRVLVAALSRDQQVLDAARRLPGAVAAISNQPPPGRVRGQFLADAAAPRGSREWPAEVSQIGGDYFKLLGIPLLRGRAFNSGDSPTAPLVIVVSQHVAQTLWPGQNPLGRQVQFGGMGTGMTVVGVVADIKPAGPGGRGRMGALQAYIPYQQPHRGRPAVIMTLLVRQPAASAPPLARLVGGVAGVAALRTSSLDAALAAVTAQPRFLLLAGAVFTALALGLIWLGVLALLASWVTAHRQELAIRLALGAAPAALARLVVVRLALMLLAALALAALAVPSESRVLAHLLFGVQPLNASIWLAALALVAVVALGAAALPALRAARTDPASALRCG